MATIKASHKPGAKSSKRRLNEIRIRRAGNGFMVHKDYEPEEGPGGMMERHREEPQVFTKHAPTRKHIAAALEEMHSPAADEPTGDTDDVANAGGGDLGTNEAPVATNP